MKNSNNDFMDISRFKIEQNLDFETALSEIKTGRKCSHWMWYIFPQLKGLGGSEMAQYYGIDGMEEAKAYLADETLRTNLLTITKALLDLPETNATAIFGIPDDLKLKSCMTIFYFAASEIGDAENANVFKSVLDKFYGGEVCRRTKSILTKDYR